MLSNLINNASMSEEVWPEAAMDGAEGPLSIAGN
jgi:hypothetical protein